MTYEALEALYAREENDFVCWAMAELLATLDRERAGSFPELATRFRHEKASLKELERGTQILPAYERIITRNREHPAALSAAVRVLTTCLLAIPERAPRSFKRTMADLLEAEPSHEQPRFVSTLAWARHALEG